MDLNKEQFIEHMKQIIEEDPNFFEDLKKRLEEPIVDWDGNPAEE